MSFIVNEPVEKYAEEHTTRFPTSSSGSRMRRARSRTRRR